MLTIFVEYVISDFCKHEYRGLMKSIKQKNPVMELLESTDQPGLFVEIWKGVHSDWYDEMKRERLEARISPWNEMSGMLKGKNDQIRIWSFSEVALSNMN